MKMTYGMRKMGKKNFLEEEGVISSILTVKVRKPIKIFTNTPLITKYKILIVYLLKNSYE